MQTSRLRLITLAGIVALAVAVLVVIVRNDRSRDLVLRVEPVDASDTITVYAGGAVAKPGLYSLPRGSRIASLIDLAGTTNQTDLALVQMAAELRDGQQVIVPEHTPTPTARSTFTPAAADGTVVSTPVMTTGPTNINTATAAELEGLPGIGPALAQRIVEYRAAHGPFATVEALADVQGISERMVQDFGDLITVGP